MPNRICIVNVSFNLLQLFESLVHRNKTEFSQGNFSGVNILPATGGPLHLYASHSQFLNHQWLTWYPDPTSLLISKYFSCVVVQINCQVGMDIGYNNFCVKSYRDMMWR